MPDIDCRPETEAKKARAPVDVDALTDKLDGCWHGSGCGFGPRSSTLTLNNSDAESAATTTVSDELEEGSFRAWLTVFGAFMALFCTFGQINAFGTFQAWYSTHQLSHLAPSTISWIGSLQLWILFFSGGPIGRLYDCFGPTIIMLSGAILYIFSIMMSSLSTQYYQFILCQGITFGLGVGMLFYPSLASVSTYFSKRRATALGIAAAGTSLGGFIYPIMLEHLFTKVGFGWGVRVSGLMSGVCSLLAVLTVTRRRPLEDPAPRPWIDFAMLKDCRFLFLTAGSCFVALGLFIPFFYIINYAHDINIPARYTFYVLAVLNAGGIIGRTAPAYLSDVVGRFNILVPSAFLSGLSCLVFWFFAKGIVSVMLFAATYGFLSGAFISLINPCVAQISDIREIGTRIGMLYTMISFPSLVGGPIAGVLLVKSHGSYDSMIAFSGATVVVGSLLLLYTKLTVDKKFFAVV
ncbi:hypothetical protein HGRIS_005582 [Hohenbuehelia grisea]|uniref:Major facilitator superfamily (MFS) profile domain-containing protein n=1 Tax=Hohenbuehelia grisea TaxID=104357 RepID=A0ABR3JXA5_9AGAR